ncbi:formyltetrahydrofolate deformylase 1, mitochondrial isoform X2 [Physcomitrium patens]|uniref:ACT domain-containing protein n=1 Tax=Physcomitrium patens TaxID=3218 RepID=A9T4E4_PHYPA|nr:formyltetrahydrofolate deformylase 1, mitochondrial-like isoform X2 [Physcomitrium patens]PNR63400.1 hypothetical protein PHYPA_001826 [Physcomitrium patens]|eukprot:XP_024394370.1 formyltetrahydrofolate deformylase 1, mitochondrial-like isoform X2 [Physcomitrella patens]
MLLGKALRDVWARRNSCSLGLLRELRRSYGCNAIGSHESRRARCYEGKGECEGGSPGEVHGVHVFQCADQLGIIARISKCIALRGANILNVDLYIDFDDKKQSPIFYARSEFAFNPLQWPRAVMDEDFAELAHHFKAEKSVVRVLGSDPDLKLAVLASWQDHCLIDLLHRWQEGELPANLSCVISNHNRGPNTHVLRFLERHGIPYHYLPTSKGNKREEEILDLVSGTDFLVLARYMQVLSPTFLKGYKKDIINIHHGLLPSFKGANPYRQAYEAGVKLIGATSHFVTEELDDGPIIEQMVDMVSHRDSLHTFATRSENLEKQCLAKAIKYYCEQRIMRYSTNKTIVFC